MPQPNSNTAQYFTHDADMRNDIKIKALRRKYGLKGYAIWCFILETLTASNDFEIEYNELTQELLASDFDVETQHLVEIIEFCTKLQLLIIEDNRLYCDALKRRFKSLQEKRERLSRAGRLGMERRWGKMKDNNNDVITTDNHLITSDNIINKNKVNKSKVKENKVNNMIYPYQDIVALWNKICGEKLPKVKTLSEARKIKIKQRLIQSAGKTEKEWLDWAQELFEKVAASNFLNGGNNHNWACSFDWLFDSANNWIKVMEGNYDNDKSSRQEQKHLGVGEFITEDGRRTYGSGVANVPATAPLRPSIRHQWSAETNEWILI